MPAPVAGHADVGFDRVHCELCRFLNPRDRFVDHEGMTALVVNLHRTDHQERSDGKGDHEFDERYTGLLLEIVHF